MMNLRSIHRWVANPFVFSALCFAIMIGSLNFINARAAFRSSNDFTGQEMFRGVYFSSGSYADLIPELHEFKMTNFTQDQAKLAHASMVENNVISQITKQSPGYFDGFRQALLSRDPVTIQNALLDGKQQLLSALAAIGIRHDENAEARLASELSQRIDMSKASPAEIAAAIKTLATPENSGPIVIDYPILYIWDIGMIIVVANPAAANNGANLQGLYFDELVNSIAGRS